MGRGGRPNSKRSHEPAYCSLQMECYEEELSPAQTAAAEKAERELKEIKARLEARMLAQGEVVERSDSHVVVQMRGPLGCMNSVATVTPSVSRQPLAVMAQNAGTLVPPLHPVQPMHAVQPVHAVKPLQAVPALQPIQAVQTIQAPPAGCNPVVLQSASGAVMPRPPGPGTLHATPAGTYQLMVNSRLGVIVGKTTSTVGTVLQTTMTTPPVAKAKPVVAKNTSLVSGTPQAARAPAIRPQQPSVPSSQVPATQTVLSKALTSATPVTAPSGLLRTTPGIITPPAVQSIKIKPKGPGNTQAMPLVRPTENNSIGGLSAGTRGSRKPLSAPVVDLTSDDKRPSSTPDSKEVTFSKVAGKTFPSLVVVARPHLRLKDIAQNTVTTDRASLDAKIKTVLLYTPTKFTEWLIQQGLVRSEQLCSTHRSPDGTHAKLKLGMYSDVSKFPYSGGYVWISDCCPQRFVSVFSGSIFEGAPHPPTALLKLIYHWACQTNIQNIVQWVKVDNFYVKNFYTNLRSVCTATIHERYERMGGMRRRVEVGVISLGTSTRGGDSRQVKVEVLGVMDPESRLVRLTAVEAVQEGERNYKHRFVKILEPLEYWVDKDSVILTDYTVDREVLHKMGFKSVFQISSNDRSPKNTKYSNYNVMEYLRRIVPRMFQSTLSLLSRQIIQQFLDELVWRERWGPVPAQAFDNMIVHLGEQTRLDTGESLLARLARVAINPFRQWRHEDLKQASEGRHDLEDNSVAPTPASSTSQSSVDLPQSVRQFETAPGAKRGRKRLADVIPATDSKRLVMSHPVEQTSLDAFYYGQQEGSAIQEEKVTLSSKCCVCRRKFSHNIALMKHLIAHTHSEFSAELSDITQCKYCLKSFATPFSMQTHVEEIHMRSTTNWVCRICEEKFRDRTALVNHMHSTHVQLELPYNCGICSFRSSSHQAIIDHFYEIHGGGEKLQCPFCLKIVAISQNGRNISTNVHFFFRHMQKHQRKSMARKCNKCALWFVHKGILKEHQQIDHRSFKDQPGVKPLSNPGGMDVMMPVPTVPAGIGPARLKSSSSVKPRATFTAVRFDCLSVSGAQDDNQCCECEGKLLNEDHFTGYMSCSRCRFATCCTKAMLEHSVVFHETAKPEFTLGRPIHLPADMYCVCGYHTNSGNRLASHLARCERKSAYPTPAAAKASTVQSASFPPLVSLDDNASEDPSDRWLKAFVPARKEEESKDQAGGAEQPSMLNVLGLVRKPSTDECSLDRDSEENADNPGAVKQDGSEPTQGHQQTEDIHDEDPPSQPESATVPDAEIFPKPLETP